MLSFLWISTLLLFYFILLYYFFYIFFLFSETKVTAKTSMRYLEVYLDQSLDCKLIAEAILKKGNSRLKFLWS